VMNTGFANAGADMIPTLFAATSYHFFRLASTVFGLFTTFEMPGNPFVWPKFTSGPTVRRVLEATQRVQGNIASGTIPESELGTDKVTFTAGKIGALTFYSDEQLRNSSVAWAEALMQEYVNAMAKAADYVVLNGDEDDTATNWSYYGATPGGTDNNRILIVDGLRKIAAANSDSVAEATFDAESPQVLQKMMGSRGIIGRDIGNLVMIMDLGTSYVADALGEYESLADVGPNATLLTGQVGQVKGVPIVVSQEMKLAEANGRYTWDGGSDAKGHTVMGHRDIVRIGRDRNQILQTESMQFSDMWGLYSMLGFDLQLMEAGGVSWIFNTTI